MYFRHDSHSQRSGLWIHIPYFYIITFDEFLLFSVTLMHCAYSGGFINRIDFATYKCIFLPICYQPGILKLITATRLLNAEILNVVLI